MPSPISHTLLSRYLPIESDSPYFNKRLYNNRYFQIGSIAPDLPYGAVADNDFLENEAFLANLFHFSEIGQDLELSPNRLPLLGLERVKDLIQKGFAKRDCDALFWFLMGYASHVIADGTCHPFIMDKVGRYEGSNKADHRSLEMGIDVLLFKHFTKSSGHAIEASFAGMDTFIGGFNQWKYANLITEHFAELIENIYKERFTKDDIKGWVTGISRIFCLSTGKWPDWFRQRDATEPFVFRQIADLEGREDVYLILEKPKFWPHNFRNTPKVHLLDDCLPHFNHLMKSFLDKAYAYVYESGQQPIERDLPTFSLDTGRTVNDPDNIELTPLLWDMA